MCCFSRPVKAVAKTRIFSRASTEGRQFLVYSMALDANEELAMILPIPVCTDCGEDAIRFINLQSYENFFGDAESCFPLHLPARGAATGRRRDTTLKVEQVGNFEASFVPSPDDFGRLDERFRLPRQLWDQLPLYRNYGFAVFELMKDKLGAQTIHPMAFEFPRAQPDDLFFPTVHIHDGTLHRKAHFDHVLYCQLSSDMAATPRSWEKSWRPMGDCITNREASKGLFDFERHCYRRELRGRLANRDTMVSDGVSSRASSG